MIFWRSVVGKLWFTILLLVSFVLFILTVMLLEYFQNHNVDETKKDLARTAVKIANVLEQHQNDPIGLEISWEIIDDSTKVVIIKNPNEIYYSPNTEKSKKLTLADIKKDQELAKVFNGRKSVEKVTTLSSGSTASYSIIGVPLHLESGKTGAVFIYQSLDVIKETTNSTTKFILLVAGVAIILTTIFAFFLSTRITAPLTNTNFNHLAIQ